jgi:hypothetical protein
MVQVTQGRLCKQIAGDIGLLGTVGASQPPDAKDEGRIA